MAVQRFPGFIDVHVHLREPGATQKEDMTSGTRAAIAGGFTFVIDMPNNPQPTVSTDRLHEKVRRADARSVCPVGFHYGTDGKNLDSFPAAWKHPRVYGLKVYMNHTTGTLLVADDQVLDRVFAAWQTEKPLLVHAEGERLERALFLASKYGRRLHVCHISSEEEVKLVRQAKHDGRTVTAGVTPHHLFLSRDDVKRLGPYARMKPEIGNTRDQQALWDGIADATIDIIESDHAPHTKKEKESQHPPSGVPGLETTLGLVFRAVHEQRLTLEHINRLLYVRPKQIFRISDQTETYIELDPDEPYVIGAYGYETKCGWSPFEGRQGYGRVRNVILSGKQVYKDGSYLYRRQV